MPNLLSSTQIERFKREAKQLCRTTVLTHSQALDRVAHSHGYDNWSLLMKHNGSPAESHRLPSTALMSSLPEPLIFNRTANEMRNALRKVPEKRDGAWSDRIAQARGRTEGICNKFSSAANAIDFAVEYVTCLLAVPRFKIDPATTVNWEMRCWLPYCAHPVNDDFDEHTVQVLVNRRYKPVGLLSDDMVKYEDFTHLHMRLSKSQLEAFSPRKPSEGYFYNDGCPPYWSRQDAASYLERLRILQTILKG